MRTDLVRVGAQYELHPTRHPSTRAEVLGWHTQHPFEGRATTLAKIQLLDEKTGEPQGEPILVTPSELRAPWHPDKIDRRQEQARFRTETIRKLTRVLDASGLPGTVKPVPRTHTKVTIELTAEEADRLAVELADLTLARRLLWGGIEERATDDGR